MRSMRSVIALDPRLFGRGRTFLLDLVEQHRPSPAWVADAKLFATTFIGGFVFVAIYLA